jgi:hypothetical protein
MRSLLLVESFGMHPSIQYILVKVIPSFRFVKMCLCQVSQVKSRCNPRCLTSSSWESCTLFIWTGEALISLCSKCDVDLLGFIGFHSTFFKPVLDCK